jgi:hypothetical protein
MDYSFCGIRAGIGYELKFLMGHWLCRGWEFLSLVDNPHDATEFQNILYLHEFTCLQMTTLLHFIGDYRVLIVKNILKYIIVGVQSPEANKLQRGGIKT